MQIMDLEDRILHEDVINVLCGTLVGEGMSRKVFECELMPSHVVKIEQNMRFHQNRKEFDAWETVMHCAHSKWFAHIYSMAHMGRVLVMEKTVRPMDNEWPDEIPAYFTDLKRENFGISLLTDPETGIVGRRFVCHDYGTNLLSTLGLTKRMQKVNWMELRA